MKNQMAHSHCIGHSALVNKALSGSMTKMCLVLNKAGHGENTSQVSFAFFAKASNAYCEKLSVQ